MCGRFSLTTQGPILAELFGIGNPAILIRWQARYNIAPTQPVIAIRAGDGETRRADLLRWGLIPRWAKDPKTGPTPINARGDTLCEKPMFKGLLRTRRAIVPADGFFEWQKVGARKLPLYFRMSDGSPFAIAALWDSWKGPDACIESVTLVTTEANQLVRAVHDRMPAILAPPALSAWLDPTLTDPSELIRLLGPYRAELMQATPVSTRVNSPAVDDPACILPQP